MTISRWNGLFKGRLITFFHITTQSNLQEVNWIDISLPSTIPFTNAYLINLFQIIITILWSGNFMSKENHSPLSVYPFSNTEFLLGKTLGWLILVVKLDIMLMLISILIHFFYSNSSFDLHPYIFYFFTFSLPNLLFFTGITLCLKGIVRHQVLSDILLFIFVYLGIFSGNTIIHGAFDPLIHLQANGFSDIIGFSGLNQYLLQRLSFFIWGTGFIIFSINFLKRLPNPKKINFSTYKIGIFTIIMGCSISGLYIHNANQYLNDRNIAQEIFIKYQHTPKVRILKHNIEFKQDKYTYTSTSQLEIMNPNQQTIDSVILYLNPSLNIINIYSEEQHFIPFHRNQQVLTLSLTMPPKDSCNITILYQGSISPAICYAEIPNHELPNYSRYYNFLHLGSDFYYLQPEYTLLTPECLWYPTSKPPVNILFPYLSDQDYTHFQLSVLEEKERIPISQGKESRDDNKIYFTNKTALPGLSLCIGKYTRKQITKNNVSYETFIFKGHEHLLPKEVLNQERLLEFWESFQYDKNKGYSFNKLNLVETPIHFCSYSRTWKNQSEYIQPEIIFRPEREALSTFPFNSDFYLKHEDPSETFINSYQKMLFDNIRKIPQKDLLFFLLSREEFPYKIKNEYNISYLTEKYHYNVYSSIFSGINLMFHIMQDGFFTRFGNWGNSPGSQFFGNNSLIDIINNPQETNLGDALLLKSYNHLKQLLVTVDYNKFEDFNLKFLQSHNFQNFNYQEFCDEVKKQFNIDFMELTRQLYLEKKLPAFYFRDARVYSTSPDNSENYIFSIKVWNKGEVDGLITLHDPSRQERHYIIPSHAYKEIKHCFSNGEKVFSFTIQTNLAENIPSSWTFKDIEPNGKAYRTEGIFDTDSLPFIPKENEYIVDNIDSGFHIIESTKPLKNRFQYPKNSYMNSLWSEVIYNNAYGEPVSSFLQKESGKGTSSVEWEAKLPISCEYEIFIYNNKTYNKAMNTSRIRKNGKDIARKPPIQTYQLVHEHGSEKISFNPLDEEEGWVSIGKYQFTAGQTKIILQGQEKDPEQYILADAVKWVKIN